MMQKRGELIHTSSESSVGLHNIVDERVSHIRGTCMSMCSESEFRLRKREKLLHPFEMDEAGTSAGQIRAVKWYSRSAAGQQSQKPCEVRPPHVLKDTVNYLLIDIMHKDVKDWIKQYDFIFDRLRAVRQDIVVQRCDIDCVGILESIVHFYAYAAYKLCDRPVSVFDSTMNSNHLSECLKWLLAIYDETDKKPHQHRGEFEALYVIFNLGDSVPLHRVLSSPEIRRLPVVKLAYQISLAYLEGNFVRTTRLMINLPIWLSCVAALHLPKIRRNAFRTWSIAYNSPNVKVPCDKVASNLFYVIHKDLINDCKHYNIQVEGGNIIFKKQAFNETAQPVMNCDEVCC